MEKTHYRNLKVWQNAIDLVPTVYEVVKRLPKTETYALGDQLRRATVSVPANIAEGQARQHSKEFLQHLSIAKGSLAEVHTLLIVAEKLGYLTGEELKRLEGHLTEVARPLHGLMKHLRTTN